MALSQGKFVPVAGGMLIKNTGGDLLGAAGVSGDTADNIEIACIACIGQLDWWWSKSFLHGPIAPLN